MEAEYIIPMDLSGGIVRAKLSRNGFIMQIE